jgi:hypothetical protein
MALANFAVSKRRSSRLAADAVESESTETGRTRSLNNSILDLRTEIEVVEEVSKLWTEAQEKFLSIGRYLCRAKVKFSGSFEKQIVGNLPFGKNIAYQLRMVAESVDSGRLPEESLPRSYATAFQLVSLPPPDYETAKTRGLVRSTVTRPEVDAFKREIKASRLNQDERHEVLINERRALKAEIKRLAARLNEIDAAIGPDEDDLPGTVVDGHSESAAG